MNLYWSDILTPLSVLDARLTILREGQMKILAYLVDARFILKAFCLTNLSSRLGNLYFSSWPTFPANFQIFSAKKTFIHFRFKISSTDFVYGFA